MIDLYFDRIKYSLMTPSSRERHLYAHKSGVEIILNNQSIKELIILIVSRQDVVH